MHIENDQFFLLENVIKLDPKEDIFYPLLDKESMLERKVSLKNLSFHFFYIFSKKANHFNPRNFRRKCFSDNIDQGD